MTVKGCFEKGDEENEFAITGEHGEKYELYELDDEYNSSSLTDRVRLARRCFC